MQKLRNHDIDPDSQPPSIKRLVLDLQFNNGLNKKDRKELFDAIKRRDWEKAKIETKKYGINSERDKSRLLLIDETIDRYKNENK